MSRYVEINKDGNNYTVNPNATPSGGSVAVYAWDSPIGTQYTNFSIAPDSREELEKEKANKYNYELRFNRYSLRK